MLPHAVPRCCAGPTRQVVVVANPGWTIPEDVGDVEVVVNDGWAEGMGSSLRLALSAEAVTGADADCLLLADMPGVTAACVGRVVTGDRRDALVQATYDGRRASSGADSAETTSTAYDAWRWTTLARVPTCPLARDLAGAGRVRRCRQRLDVATRSRS